MILKSDLIYRRSNKVFDIIIYLKWKACFSWNSVKQEGFEEHATVWIPVVVQKTPNRTCKVDSGVVAVKTELVICLEHEMKILIKLPSLRITDYVNSSIFCLSKALDVNDTGLMIFTITVPLL